MEIFINSWLPGIVISLSFLVFPHARSGVLQWLRTYRRKARENGAQNWRLPEGVRKWLDRLGYCLFGYMFALVAVLVALLTMSHKSRDRIAAEYFIQEGVLSDDAGVALAIVMLPVLIMIVPILVAAYVEMLVSIRRQWQETKTFREKLTFVVVYSFLAMFAISLILSNFLQ